MADFNYSPLANVGYQDPLESFGGMGSWGQPKTGMAPYVPGAIAGQYGSTGIGIPGFGAPTGGLAGAAGGGNWMDMLGGMDGLKTGMGALGGLANAFMSMQQYGLAKKTFAENKRQFELNYGAQRDTTNTQMRDRQAARVASNSGAYQSVDDYMNENRIK